MDSAAIKSQTRKIQRHEEQITSVCHGVRELNECHEGFQSPIISQVGHLNDQMQQLITPFHSLGSIAPAAMKSQAPVSAPLPSSVPHYVQATEVFK